MNYIIFDLETTMNPSSNGVRHIIEVAAVKISRKGDNLEIYDTFQAYVKPPTFDAINKRTLKFIGTSFDSIKRSLPLPNVVTGFKKWIGNEDYYLCAWSDSDIRILASNRSVQKFDMSWFKNFNDVQPLLCHIATGSSERLSLKKVLKIYNEDTGNEKFHSALLDSFSTASLFIKSFNILEKHLERNINSFSIISSPLYRVCKKCNREVRIFSPKGKSKKYCSPCRNEIKELVTTQ